MYAFQLFHPIEPVLFFYLHCDLRAETRGVTLMSYLSLNCLNCRQVSETVSVRLRANVESSPENVYI